MTKAEQYYRKVNDLPVNEYPILGRKHHLIIEQMHEFAQQQLKNCNLQNVTNLVFAGIGYCGMSKDIEVRGRLTEVRKEHDHATITDEKGQPHAVILKTVKTCW